MARHHNATGRSKGEGRYVRLPHYVLESAAFLSLSPVDVRLYVELERRYNGSNNGKIHLSVREAAEKIHGSPATASRALARLTGRGFIAPMVKGAFSLKTRHATEWRLLIYPQGSEAVAPKSFMRWQPQPIAKPAQELSEDEKKQNAVRVAQLLVSVVKPFGARGATERSEIGPDGACGETVEAEKQASRFH
jgi:hypothetical protein